MAPETLTNLVNHYEGNGKQVPEQLREAALDEEAQMTIETGKDQSETKNPA